MAMASALQFAAAVLEDALDVLVAIDEVDTTLELLADVVVELASDELLDRLVLAITEEVVTELLLLGRDDDELVDEPIPGANTAKL